MTNLNYFRKILFGCLAVLLPVTIDAFAFQRGTTNRPRSTPTVTSRFGTFDNTRVHGALRLQLGGDNNGATERGRNNPRKQRGSLLRGRWRSRNSPSTRLAVSAKSSLAGDSDKKQSLISKKIQGRLKLGLLTTLRVGIPSIIAGIVAFFAFPSISLWLCSLFQDQGVFAVLSQDSSQFVQNFLSVSSLLFSILVGQTYYFMYQQQEMVYYALFDEVTEAKSLLEQVALVSQGRAMYGRVLACMSTYVQEDLKALEKDPAILLSSRPMDDPLETIMYLVSRSSSRS